jgi:hypothetical protein
MIERIQDGLAKVSRAWAAGRGFDSARAGELRHQAILDNHAHYVNNIAVYRRLAGEMGIGESTTVDTIKNRLMLADDVFKSYDQQWLDDGDYARMTGWLSGLYHRPANIDVSGIASIDEWADRLGSSGIRLVYSSGTSGAFSFVPRDATHWASARNANIACLAGLLTRRLTGNQHAGMLPRLVSTARLTDSLVRAVLRDFDAVFLGFRHGRMGNQALIQELAPLFRRRCFLYDIDLSASALRGLRGPASADGQRDEVESLTAEVVTRREENYRRVLSSISESTGRGNRVFIFGAPFQFRELCEFAAGMKDELALKQGSIVLFGGGWKSFTGETVERESLVGKLLETFGLPQEMVLEGYSMTEISPDAAL